MTTEHDALPMTRAEREVETGAARVNELAEEALVMVAVRSVQRIDDLDTSADRIERAARDLSVALRELAHERRRRAEDGD